MLVQEFLEQSAKARPAKTALICGGKRFTYAELDAAANRLANLFRSQGIERGNRIALFLGNWAETVIGIFAVLKAGATFVALNRSTKPDKVVSILNNCEAKVILVDARSMSQGVGDRLLGNVPSLQIIVVCGDKASSFANGHGRCLDFNHIQSDSSPAPLPASNIDLDLACLIYTSGTTGESKGVMCDHSNVVFVTKSITQYLKNSEQDIILSVLPLAFSYGLYQLMATFATGGTLVLEESFAFPALIIEKIAAERVTGFPGVPTIFASMLNLDLKPFDLSSLRYLTNAAAGLPLEHVKKLRQTLPHVDLVLMHGLTEVARTMFLPPDQVDQRPASSGMAIPGTELWVEDEAGRRLGPGQAGELVVRGRNVMRGYWKDEALTNQRFRPGPISGERICYSGDLFKTDEQGYFYFISRKDDIIKSRGEKVPPREVENVLYGIPGVQEAAVIGVPDALMGEVIKAFIVAPGGTLTEAAVISHCKTRLEEFMVPRHVEFRSELPKTGSGKIRRIDLR